MKIKVLLVLLLCSISAFSQEKLSDETEPVKKHKLQKKGDFYFTWGYNRSWYDKSDIHFIGPNYDFTLHNVVASDRPTELGWTYINPVEISIPQFNFRIGYFISDKYSISIGWDHMKYVVDVPQKATISGYIGSTISDPAISTNVSSGNYAGTYADGTPFEIQSDFLTFEHTDGLNFASIDLERYDLLWQSKRQPKLGLTLMTGLGAGPVIPRSDVHFFGVGANHYWNLSGYGAAAKTGLNFDILSWLFLKTEFKIGFIDLQKIPTTGRSVDVAKQNIVFYENSWCIGFKF